MTTKTYLLPPAQDAAARGWCVIPIRHRPGTAGKQPALPWLPYQTRQPTDAELRGWFGAPGWADGLAVILGEISGGLCCRDFDDLDAYQNWADAHPALAASLPTAITARGRHVYFMSAWRGFVRLTDGDLRGDSRHYTLLPPSSHPSGGNYRWVVPPMPHPDGIRTLPSGAAIPMIDPVAAGLLPGNECPVSAVMPRNAPRLDVRSPAASATYGQRSNGPLLGYVCRSTF
jgi:hypothetical protein